jgi:anthranilate synthase/aminodeoxychorismate synthase-like glutamine amidotransferase
MYIRRMRIALIDNEDSFTYNILNILRQFEEITTTVLLASDLNILEIQNFDKIIISPGPGLPEDFPVLLDILQVYQEKKSILGICLGHQAICSFYGAQLLNLPAVQHGQSQEVKIINKSKIFTGLPNKFQVGLYHSWIVDRNDFPDELQITTISPNKLIMSVSHKKYDMHGVQFHPESYLCEYGQQIIRNFIF